MSNHSLIAIVATEARAAMPKDGDLQAKAEAAMTSAADHWMVLDREMQFRGALAALLVEYPDETAEGKRLRYEIKQLQKFSALIVATQAGLDVGLNDIEVEEGPHTELIGLMAMWRRVTKP